MVRKYMGRLFIKTLMGKKKTRIFKLGNLRIKYRDNLYKCVLRVETNQESYNVLVTCILITIRTHWDSELKEPERKHLLELNNDLIRRVPAG